MRHELKCCSRESLRLARILEFGCRLTTGLLVSVVALTAGCGGGTGPAVDGFAGDGGAGDTSYPVVDHGGSDVGTEPTQTLVDVGHERELRGIWIATVFNIDFPSEKGLSAEAQKGELVRILEVTAAARLNAVVFQVRPEADALYASQLEPWSRYLVGTQGQDPGYDPLAYLVEQARERSIEVHAWFNPYRAKASASSVAVAPHLSVTMAEHARSYGGYVWMDPGVAAVEDHTVAVVLDVVRRYDIDGVHMDDYFYPYPDGTEFPDAATYSAYQAAGGTLGRADWRRDNVNRLVERLSSEIAAVKRHVRFGISPFGIYRPGIPPGIVGLDQYAEIYADPPLWKASGWVDYLAPQLYWPSTKEPQAFGTLIEWWSDLPRADRYTFAGIYLSRLGETSAWDLDEYRTQIELCRAQSAANSRGQIFFSFNPLADNRQGVAEVLRDEIYSELALPPPLATAVEGSVAPPRVRLGAEPGRVEISAAEGAGNLRGWLVYAPAADGRFSRLVEILPPSRSSLQLDPGGWAISAVARDNTESRGVLVESTGGANH